MKLNLPKRDGVKRPPLRTFKEMAEELGVHPNTVVRMIQSHPEGAPKPKLTHRNSGFDQCRHTWYEREPFLKWWKSIPRG